MWSRAWRCSLLKPDTGPRYQSVRWLSLCFAALVLFVAVPVVRVAEPPGGVIPATSVAQSTPSEWYVECVDCPKDFAQMTDRNLRLDGAGHPHLAYGGDHLYYAWHNGAWWNYETVDAAPNVGLDASLVLDALAYPHISYYDAYHDDLKYAWYDGSTWHNEAVESKGDVGQCTSLALDAMDRPHVSYRDYSNGDLKYAWNDGAHWHIEIVDDSPGDMGLDTSLVLDGAGHPHIAYSDSYGAYSSADLKYAWHDGTTWHVETVNPPNDDDLLVSASLALDSMGRPTMITVTVASITWTMPGATGPVGTLRW
jgi:hypothetical protein